MWWDQDPREAPAYLRCLEQDRSTGQPCRMSHVPGEQHCKEITAWCWMSSWCSSASTLGRVTMLSTSNQEFLRPQCPGGGQLSHPPLQKQLPLSHQPGFSEQQRHLYLTNCCVSGWLQLKLPYHPSKPPAELSPITCGLPLLP